MNNIGRNVSARLIIDADANAVVAIRAVVGNEDVCMLLRAPDATI
jgi:hypothetical protein